MPRCLGVKVTLRCRGVLRCQIYSIMPCRAHGADESSVVGFILTCRGAREPKYSGVSKSSPWSDLLGHAEMLSVGVEVPRDRSRGVLCSQIYSVMRVAKVSSPRGAEVTLRCQGPEVLRNAARLDLLCHAEVPGRVVEEFFVIRFTFLAITYLALNWGSYMRAPHDNVREGIVHAVVLQHDALRHRVVYPLPEKDELIFNSPIVFIDDRLSPRYPRGATCGLGRARPAATSYCGRGAGLTVGVFFTLCKHFDIGRRNSNAPWLRPCIWDVPNSSPIKVVIRVVLCWDERFLVLMFELEMLVLEPL
ncbi:hypothetical protein NE237_030474 [Protea cynaroides]|uniref:Uncharacterized protein n=1 Tax=Protea cynaroides TaxID=273540 RepID=A0A9Q0JW32_9MAGN|nr:hypothetical protein NE237_030474 [Protea cynaroides]